MRPDFRTFQYSSRAKIPIHHGARTDRKGRIDRKQVITALLSQSSMSGSYHLDLTWWHIWSKAQTMLK